MQFLLAAADPMDEVLRHTLFHIGPMDVTNQMMMAVLAGALMLLVFPKLFATAAADAPTGSKNFFESILEFLRVEVVRPALKEHTDRFLPFLWTLFFFILFCNLLGQLPVAEFITFFTHRESHWWGTATGTPTTTGALAVCAFFFIHISGIQQVAKSLMDGTYGHHAHHNEHSSDGSHGHESAQDLEHMRGDALAADIPGDFKAIGNPTAHYVDDQHHAHQGHALDYHADGPKMTAGAAWALAIPLYLWNFAPHPFKPGPGQSPLLWIPDVFIWLVLLILEMIGAVIKPFALMIRLFANMIAGHIVLGSLILLIPVTAGIAHQLAIGAPLTVLVLLIRFLELFVAFLQAYIFTFLTTLFIASAVAPEH
jgi:F0F1-type ATP synthase membrane subunit a